jgi:hypothetical protein
MNNQPTPEQQAQVYALTDIMMRILAGRPLSICTSVFASGYMSIAENLPTDGRKYLTDNLKQLVQDIEAIEDPQQDLIDGPAVPFKPTLVQ